MDAKELRTLGVDELQARCRQWAEDLFRARFGAQSVEAKDTSIFKKLRRDIARAKTVLTEKIKVGDVGDKKMATVVGDQNVAPTKTASKKVTANKSVTKKSKEQGKES
ncbi:MAG: 50S ribosomal protein L29 [Bdellovibrionales bacterium]|nr:50S ribosomal protein L29 [Bdellovibrionales bacterium]